MKNLFFIVAIFISLKCIGQEKIKDTLFIKLNKSFYSKIEEKTKDFFYYISINPKEKEDLIYFIEKRRYYDLKFKKVYCLKEILKKSNVFSKKGQIDNLMLVKYLGDFTLFFVKKNEFIKVETIYSIE